MRITCTDVDGFLTNLESADSVHRNTVFYNRTRRHLEGYSYEIVYQLTAILEFADDSQALLETGEICGTDQETADGKSDGSERAINLVEKVGKFCIKHNLKMLPGILDT